jgi:hypothetical protein
MWMATVLQGVLPIASQSAPLGANIRTKATGSAGSTNESSTDDLHRGDPGTGTQALVAATIPLVVLIVGVIGLWLASRIRLPQGRLQAERKRPSKYKKMARKKMDGDGKSEFAESQVTMVPAETPQDMEGPLDDDISIETLAVGDAPR